MIKPDEYCDFHVHSTCSDGTLSPTELIQMAAKRKIALMALTDHDTVAGIHEARLEADRLGVKFVSGIEISAMYKGGTLHYLGFGIKEDSGELLKKLKVFQKARNERNVKILHRLNDLGITIGMEELNSFKSPKMSLGRPHIARILMQRGLVNNFDQAFALFLGKKGKAFVEKEIFSAQESIQCIHDAGGLAFIAHPVSLNLGRADVLKFLKKQKEIGLDGIEVYSSAHAHPQALLFKSIAQELHLMVSAGSDYHGENKKGVELGVIHNRNKIRSQLISKELLDFVQNK